MGFLEDGTGAGYRQKVTSSNRSSVDALNRSALHTASFENSNAYIVNTATTAVTLTQTGTIGTMLIVQNDSSTQVMVISQIVIGTNANNAIIRLVKNYTIGSVTNNNAFTPVNLDFRSSTVAEATVYSWDEVGNGIGGLTGGTVLGTMLQERDSTIYTFEEGILLGKNDNIAVDIDLADEITTNLIFYYRPAE